VDATERTTRIGTLTAVLTVECVLLCVMGCNEPVFEPFADRDVYFSIYGVLNASADTQRIRISPIRRSISLTDESFDAVVKLQDMDTQEVFELHGSPVRYEPTIEGAPDEIRWDFWTTHSIEPGASYRLTVTRPDGAFSEVVVPIAERFDTVVVGYMPAFFSFGVEGDPFVRVEEAEHLALVNVRHFYESSCDQTPGYHTVRFHPLDSLSTVPIHTDVDPSQLPCRVESQDIFVVASGSEWPRDKAFDPNALNVLDRPQMVQNGIGSLMGVVTRSVPVESCAIPAWTDQAALGTPCEVTYGPESATMRGTVRDALCGDRIGGAIVELEAPPGGLHPYARVRSTRTDASDGTYRVEGLDPGIPHIRRVWDKTVWYSGGRIWAAQEDTVYFLPGQQRAEDFELERRAPAGLPLGPLCD